jgi:tRNA-Thr(GGU) m(6)t(6)A37 methyltransferase TsaA
MTSGGEHPGLTDLGRCPLPTIGVVRTGRTTTETTPVQSSLNEEELGVAEIDEQFREALAGRADFDYLWLITWLGCTGDPVPPPLTQVPFLLRPQRRSMGILATRGPRRPNPIGLSLVRLVRVDGTSISFQGVDMVDGTPLLDVKPYVARFDRPPGEPRSGWFDGVETPRSVTPEQLLGRGDAITGW